MAQEVQGHRDVAEEAHPASDHRVEGAAHEPIVKHGEDGPGVLVPDDVPAQKSGIWSFMCRAKKEKNKYYVETSIKKISL